MSNTYLNLSISLLFIINLVQIAYAPPVTQTKNSDGDASSNNTDEKTDGLENFLEYHRYIREVVNALESDPKFREKLEKANEDDIRSGKIAEELDFVDHNVRTRLDEIKRAEIQRLKELVAKKEELVNQEEYKDDPTHHHLDHDNPHTFEVKDLQKLIAKTTADLAEADRKRREEFKQYELEKEYKKFQELNSTTGEEHEKLEKKYKEMEEKHKKHEKLHTPGHKQQLEEVWEEQDHMQQDFDPRTFFMLHDLDGNGRWDQDEVKALFVKELDKMYQQGAPEDDMRERYEEMERMRESVFQEMDANRDGFIDYQEFLAETQRDDFNKDPGWKGLDEERPYTQEELDNYIREKPHDPPYYHGGYPPQQQGYHPGQQQGGGYPNQGYQQQQQYMNQHPANGQYQPDYHQAGGNPQYHGGNVQYQGGNPQYQGGNPQYHPQGGGNPQYQGGNPQYQGGNPQYQGGNPQYHPSQTGGNPQYHQQNYPNPPQQGYQQQNQGNVQGIPPSSSSSSSTYSPAAQGQFHPGQLPQAQVNPQNIPNPPHAPPAPPVPPLNTNEVHPNQDQIKQTNQHNQQNQVNQQQQQQPKANMV